MDDHGHAEFVADTVDEHDEKLYERADRAVQSCPEDALSWAADREVAR